MKRSNILLVIGLFCVAFIIGGCTKQNPTFTEFIGTWIAQDSCIVILKKDSTCLVENINISRLHNHTEKSLISFIGKWNFRKVNDTGYEEYNIIIESDSINFYESFTISGQGLFKNNPPWSFSQFIGDPDDLNNYKFIKLK